MESAISNHSLFKNPYLIPAIVKFIELSNIIGIKKIYIILFTYVT